MSGWLIRYSDGSMQFEVGYFQPDGEWYCHSGFDVQNDADIHCHYLNGGEAEG